MSPLVRPAGLLVLAAAVVVTVGPAGTAPAADKEQIQAALDKGVAFLKARAAGMAPAGGVPLGATGHGVGPAALVGVALLSADVPPADPGVQAIAKAVRQAAVRVPADHQTYQLALCLLFLDKLGEPEDVPLIQAVAVQLLVGQTTSGGWDYTCVEDPTMDSTLQAGLRDRKLTPGTKDEKGNPQLHPAVAAYYQQIAGRTKRRDIGDNSNTQFGVLAVWAARKHGVPVEPALNAVVKRFFGSQMADGGWGYSETGGNAGSRASMTCAGLLALATHVARKEEEWAAAVARKDEKKAPKEAGKPGDGFFTPAGKAEKKDRRPADPVDERVGVALRSLGEAFARAAQGAGGQAARLDDFYFLWSVERVGVLYDVAKIGNVDWYAVGADFLVRNQRPDGSWSIGAYQHEVNTAFAVLFLAKANLAGDLTRKMKGAGVVELSTGGPPGGAERAARPMPLGPVPA
ncbi:MAG: hypothetical protein K2X87_23690, partial [Gemmataceae bacterium]|nr:hypothetical protein [Gemmataceae bacterium]